MQQWARRTVGCTESSILKPQHVIYKTELPGNNSECWLSPFSSLFRPFSLSLAPSLTLFRSGSSLNIARN